MRGLALPEAEGTGILVDGEVGRSQEGLTEDRNVVGVDPLQTVQHDLARGVVEGGLPLGVDTSIWHNKLGVWDRYLQS